MMKRILLLWLFACSLAYAGPSTINTGIPAQGQPYASGPLRGNYSAAANDINGLISLNNGSTAPTFPVLGQYWLNTTHSPYVLNVWDGGAWAFVCNLDPVGHSCIGTASTGSGTVTSIAVTVPSELTISGSPISVSGTFGFGKSTQAANTVWAGPASGSAATSGFRALVGADIPNPSASSLGGVESITSLSNNWVAYIDTSGVPHQSQPAFSNLSGSAACSQTPAYTGDTTKSAGSCTTVVAAVNGVTYSASPSTNTVPVVTGSGVTTYEPVPNAALANSSLTVAGHSISLGGTQAIACADLSNGSTGCAASTGVSGHAIPFLDGANIWSAANAFGVGNFGLQGTSTGVTTINSANTTGSNYTVVMPAASDTITMNAATQTLTNKSIDASEITSGIFSTSRIPVATSGALGGVQGDGATLAISTGVISVNLANANAWTGAQAYQGTSNTEAIKLTNAAEAILVTAAAPVLTTNMDVSLGAVQYYTSNATTNFTLNWRWSSGASMNTAMAVGDSATTVFMVTNGATPYYPTTFTIDGSGVTPKWQGGTAPTSGNASAIDVYTCTIIKTASATYTELCAQTEYK